MSTYPRPKGHLCSGSCPYSLSQEPRHIRDGLAVLAHHPPLLKGIVSRVGNPSSVPLPSGHLSFSSYLGSPLEESLLSSSHLPLLATLQLLPLAPAPAPAHAFITPVKVPESRAHFSIPYGCPSRSIRRRGRSPLVFFWFSPASPPSPRYPSPALHALRFRLLMLVLGRLLFPLPAAKCPSSVVG